MGHLLIDAAAARACSELRPGKGQDSGRQLAQNMLSSLAGVLCHDPGVGITELEALRDLLCLARGALGEQVGSGVLRFCKLDPCLMPLPVPRGPGRPGTWRIMALHRLSTDAG